MPKGSFRAAWLNEASRQGPLKRLLMRSVAHNDDLMAKLEAEATAKAKASGNGALPWADIISMLMPLLLKLLESLLNKK